MSLVRTEDMIKEKATQYCEQYGIIYYRIEGYFLIYNTSYPAYLGQPHYTYQHKIDLRTGKQVESKLLKGFDKKGLHNGR